MQTACAPIDWSRGRLEAVRICPACGESSAVVREYSRCDDMLAMPDIWRVVRCAECRSLYLASRPDAESLPLAYADYYTHNPESNELVSDTSRGALSALINGYLNWRFRMNRQPALAAGAWIFSFIPTLRMKLDIYGRHLPKPKCNAHTRLLDVGCGNGDFLLRAGEMGVQAWGCEPDNLAAKACQAHGLKVTQGAVFDAGFDDESFDFITLNHVIEHLLDPHATLTKLQELLVPGGMLWLALPNPNALGVRVFGKGWKGFHPPFHLVIPSQRVLLRWLNDSGFVRPRLIRRGAQSPGMWRESAQLARREGTAPAELLMATARRFGDLLSTFSPRWSEETIVVAYKRG